MSRDTLQPLQTMRVKSWTPYHGPSDSVRGYLSLELFDGMTISGCVLVQRDGGERWVCGPSRRINIDGRRFHERLLEFRSLKLRDEFSKLALEALDEYQRAVQQ